MPAFLTHLLPLADRIRAYAGPETLDGREGYSVLPNKVELVVSVVGGHLGDPDATEDADASGPSEILPRPPARLVSSREVLASGGRYWAADVRVGPITPAYDGGGYTPEQLQPDVTESASLGDAASTDVLYRLSEGPLAGDYEIIDLRTDDPLGYYLTLRRRGATP